MLLIWGTQVVFEKSSTVLQSLIVMQLFQTGTGKGESGKANAEVEILSLTMRAAANNLKS